MASDFNKRHYICTTGSVASVNGTGHIYSVKSTANMDNGTLAKIGNLVVNESEIFEVTLPALGDKVILINNPAMGYEQYTTLQGAEYNYYNEAGEIVRAYDLTSGDRIGVSIEAFTPIKADTGLVLNNYIVNDGKGGYKEVADLAGTEGFVGQVLEIRTFGKGDTRAIYRVIQNTQK